MNEHRIKRMRRFGLLLILAALAASCTTEKQPIQSATESATHLSWATSPPLGWNSWDYYGTSITEEQAKAQATAMAEHLLPAGYDVFTVDIQWYAPNADSHFYDPNEVHTMDAFGRLQPAPNRFPSAANGKGFTELARWVHDKGLRFGIHIMRGIPKQAVAKNTAVFGTDVFAQDIALTDSICPWNPDMYGVDARIPAGQAYYDSIIQMYADWGVDFIKVDDIARPYDDIQRAEIEAIRKAIDKTGRPIVLSLSPGATPVSAGPHVVEHANMWRITDDFWDRWGALREMFERVHAWEPYRREGAWPDADMLPLGKVDFGRETRFTEEEQYTLMTLWSIARSPLIFGGDMTQLDSLTLKLLTNPEVLSVNQNSRANRQVSRDNNLIVWTADVPNSNDKYVALFNAQSRGDNVAFADADYASPILAGPGRSQDISISVAGKNQLILYVNDGGDGSGWDHAAWVNPVLSGPEGELSLTELEWDYADTGWDEVKLHKTVENDPIVYQGKTVPGIGTHANSTIIYTLPDGYETFSVTGLTTNNGPLIFGVRARSAQPQEFSDVSTVTVNFSDIGLQGEVQVRDLWSQQNIGVFTDAFSADLPMHGSGLYRLSVK